MAEKGTVGNEPTETLLPDLAELNGEVFRIASVAFHSFQGRELACVDVEEKGSFKTFDKRLIAQLRKIARILRKHYLTSVDVLLKDGEMYLLHKLSGEVED